MNSEAEPVSARDAAQAISEAVEKGKEFYFQVSRRIAITLAVIIAGAGGSAGISLVRIYVEPPWLWWIHLGFVLMVCYGAMEAIYQFSKRAQLFELAPPLIRYPLVLGLKFTKCRHQPFYCRDFKWWWREWLEDRRTMPELGDIYQGATNFRCHEVTSEWDAEIDVVSLKMLDSGAAWNTSRGRLCDKFKKT